jgi:hypothetical protein
MPVTTRRRNLTVKYGHEYGYEIMHYPNGALHSETTWVDADYGGVVGDQLTISEGHPWRSRPKGRNSEDIGGDFFTQKRTCVAGSNAGPQTFLNKEVNDVWTRDSIFRASPYAVSPFTVPWAPYVSSSKADLMKKGTTAIARCSPTNSVADAAVFFGEAFKDGLPSLINPFNWETKLNLFKDLGDEFLNYEFGWLPFISDIRKTAEAINRVNAVLAQFERDSGRNVRRNYRFPTTKSKTSSLYKSGVYPYWGPNNLFWITNSLAGGGTIIKTSETSKSCWFSGAFTYHLPSGYDSRNQMDRAGLAAKLVFGAELTPQTLWEMAPWSWAIDWVTNAGDVLKNLSAWSSYGQVLRYGYVMEHSIAKDTYSFYHSPNYIGTGNNPRRKMEVSDMVILSETKQRYRANPFGFGITWDGLSPLQLAIAAALGITRKL